jgi:outer membrane murein-binding lipoprotein Lpp
MDDRVPNPPSVAGVPPNIGERLARLEAGQDWIKIVLGLLGAVVIGGFAFLGVQVGRLDSKMDALSTSLNARMDAQTAATHSDINALSARISAENAQTRQELVGIANAISNSITAARQVQPQIVIVPTPVPDGAPAPNSPPKR